MLLSIGRPPVQSWSDIAIALTVEVNESIAWIYTKYRRGECYTFECGERAIEEVTSMKKMFLLYIGLPIALLVVGLAYSAAQDTTITGYITCSVCAAKGANSGHFDCMEKCLAKGAKVVIVVDDDQRIVPIENPDTVSGHHAHRVALFGYLNNNGFHVVSVRIL